MWGSERKLPRCQEEALSRCQEEALSRCQRSIHAQKSIQCQEEALSRCQEEALSRCQRSIHAQRSIQCLEEALSRCQRRLPCINFGQMPVQDHSSQRGYRTHRGRGCRSQWRFHRGCKQNYWSIFSYTQRGSQWGLHRGCQGDLKTTQPQHARPGKHDQTHWRLAGKGKTVHMGGGAKRSLVQDPQDFGSVLENLPFWQEKEEHCHLRHGLNNWPQWSPSTGQLRWYKITHCLLHQDQYRQRSKIHSKWGTAPGRSLPPQKILPPPDRR